jgi:hypothetical protein
MREMRTTLSVQIWKMTNLILQNLISSVIFHLPQLQQPVFLSKRILSRAPKRDVCDLQQRDCIKRLQFPQPLLFRTKILSHALKKGVCKKKSRHLQQSDCLNRLQFHQPLLFRTKILSRFKERVLYGLSS